MPSQIKMCQLQTQRFQLFTIGIQGLKIEVYRDKEKRRLLSPSKFKTLDDKGSMCHITMKFHLPKC